MFVQRFLAILTTRNKEFLRDRSSVGWNIVMPVLIVAGFALIFSGQFADQYKDLYFIVKEQKLINF